MNIAVIEDANSDLQEPICIVIPGWKSSQPIIA